MSKPGPLGAFLRARRGQLRLEDVGLRAFDEKRRVAGLRREEVARLAGVGISYYTRLEQGQSLNASVEVLDAIAGALRLDDVERAHLHRLASMHRTPREAPPLAEAERVAPETEQLLDALGDTPAILLGRRTDVLAWNRTGHALFAGHIDRDAPQDPAARPNMARMVFLDAHTRDLYVDWDSKARAVVGNLRLIAGQVPGDSQLANLIGELAIQSGEFASMWSKNKVRDCDIAVFSMRHPVVGELTVSQQTLPVPIADGQRLVVATAPMESAAAVSLCLLAQAVAPVRSRLPASSR